jgi:protein-disulfide isomerase
MEFPQLSRPSGAASASLAIRSPAMPNWQSADRVRGMGSAPPELLLGRFQVIGCRSDGRVRVLDALDVAVQRDLGDGAAQPPRPGAPPVRLVSLPVCMAPGASATHPRPGVDLDQILERQGRYALGCEGVLRPNAVGFTASDPLGPDGEEPLARLIIAYAAPSAALDDELRNGAASPRRVAELVRAISLMLRRLHDQGVSHGCLRPELIGAERGTAWLGGFGVAPLAHAVDGARLVAAAVPPAYRAPEQQGPSPAQPQPWSDTYALGVVAASLLAGANPSDDVMPTPRALGAVVSDRVEALVGAALSRSPAGRPGDLAAWSEELAAALVPSSGSSALQLGRDDPVRAPEVPVEEAPTGEPGTAPPEFHRLGESAVPPKLGAPPAQQHTVDTARVALGPQRGASTGLRLLIGLMLLGGVLGLGATVVVGFLMAMRTPSPPTTTAAGGAAATPPAPPAWVAPPPVDAGSVPEASRPHDSGMNDCVEPDSGPPDAAPPGAPGTPHDAFSVRDTRAGIPVDGRAPIWGTADAWVTIVVFGDLECEHTRRAYALMNELRATYPNQLRVAWRNRPLATHSHAVDAAVVAVSLFEELGDEAFFRFWRAAGRSPEAAVDLGTWAAEAGAMPGRVQVWLRPGPQPAALARDLEIAGRFNIRATPTFFMNGVRIEGYHPIEAFAPMLLRELEASRAALARGIPPEDLYRVRVNRNLINVGPEN